MRKKLSKTFKGLKKRLVNIRSMKCVRIVAVSGFVVVILSLLLMTITPAARLSANVETEVWSIDLNKGNVLSKDLLQLNITNPTKFNCGPSVPISVQFAEILPVELRFTFTIDEQNRPIIIIYSTDANKSYGTLNCAEKNIEISGVNSFYFPGQTFEMRIVQEGMVTLGQLPPSGVAEKKVLINGIITASSSSFPFKSGRVVENTNLYPGDQVYFSSANSNGADIRATTFARFNPDKKLYQVVVHSNAHVANVRQVGGDWSYPISRVPSFWSRLEAQGEWAFILIIFTLIMNFFNFFLLNLNYKRIESAIRSIKE